MSRKPRPAVPAPLPPVDGKGNSLQVGDWVRLVAIPPAVAATPPETQALFRRALGQTFRIESFGPYGHA